MKNTIFNILGYGGILLLFILMERYRFTHVNLTETQLFINLWWLTPGCILCMVILKLGQKK